MAFYFSPQNEIVRLCLMGMGSDKTDDALALFMKAYEISTNDFERFMAAYYIARCKADLEERATWYLKSLACAKAIDDDNVISVYHTLYTCLSDTYAALRENEKASHYEALAKATNMTPTDKGPFYHGTRAALQVGDYLTPGGKSNYQDALIMNHIYFTANINGAGLAASLAKGEGPERVYCVEPTGDFEHDPNVTNKKFPGNLTRSYRSLKPLRIIGEIEDWQKQTPESLEEWRRKLDQGKGEIIN